MADENGKAMFGLWRDIRTLRAQIDGCDTLMNTAVDFLNLVPASVAPEQARQIIIAIQAYKEALEAIVGSTDEEMGDRRPLAAKRRPELVAPGAHRHYK